MSALANKFAIEKEEAHMALLSQFSLIIAGVALFAFAALSASGAELFKLPAQNPFIHASQVSSLVYLEALLSTVANGLDLLGLAWGVPMIVLGCARISSGASDAMKRIIFGCAGIAGSITASGCINCLVVAFRNLVIVN